MKPIHTGKNGKTPEFALCPEEFSVSADLLKQVADTKRELIELTQRLEKTGTRSYDREVMEVRNRISKIMMRVNEGLEGSGAEYRSFEGKLPHVSLTDPNTKTYEILRDHPYFNLVTDLYVRYDRSPGSSKKVTVDEIEELLGSGLMTNIRKLRIRGERVVCPQGAHAIAASEELSSLRRLDLGEHRVGKGAEAIAASPGLSGLETLILYGNGITSKGAQALAKSDNFPNLLQLFLSHNPRIGIRAVRAFAESESLKSLLYLDISCCGLNLDQDDPLLTRLSERDITVRCDD